MFTLTSDFNVCLSDTAINSTESYFIKIVRLSMTVLFHSDNFTLPILKRAQHHSVTYKCRKRQECLHLLGSIVVSIPACHAGDPEWILKCCCFRLLKTQPKGQKLANELENELDVQ
ncbi:hypothetical protein T4B_6767 [Trichinella pseudospiralis]|uniref:Uncharacterized protein n=1 Tax=Trichinella pseudospiralis TaxID=6337 RepID=A0A0V1KD84_TRIPS|nr:hypothetical protein T4B_6767 [Trichinella pseudospiralis]KRZ45161.1 hypothetical protein T4C_9868 [Trichinella pseudospiralis]